MKRLLLISLLLTSLVSQAQFTGFRIGRVHPYYPYVSGYTRQNLIFSADPNDVTTFPAPWDVWFSSATSGITRSNTVGGRFGAGYAYKFFTDKAQVDMTGLGCRAEFWLFSPAAGAAQAGYQNFERWLGFSLYIPSPWVFETNDNIYHILSQIHDNCFSYPSEVELKSAFEFGIWKNKWTFVNRSNLTLNGGITTELLPANRTAMNISNPTVTKGVWHDFVFHLKFKNGAAVDADQAVVQIWIDGVLCADYGPQSGTAPTLRMGYVHTQPPYLKFGNYSYMWNPENYPDYTGFEQEPTKTHYGTLVRYGNASATFADVDPSVP